MLITVLCRIYENWANSSPLPDSYASLLQFSTHPLISCTRYSYGLCPSNAQHPLCVQPFHLFIWKPMLKGATFIVENEVGRMLIWTRKRLPTILAIVFGGHSATWVWRARRFERLWSIPDVGFLSHLWDGLRSNYGSTSTAFQLKTILSIFCCTRNFKGFENKILKLNRFGFMSYLCWASLSDLQHGHPPKLKSSNAIPRSYT